MQFLSSGSWCFSWERHVTFSALSVYAGPSFWNALHRSLFPPLPDQLLCTFGSSAPHLLRCLPACFSTPMARCLSRGMIIVSVFGNLPDCKLLQFVRPSLSIMFSEGLAHSNFLQLGGFPGGAVVKESACRARDMGSSPEAWRSPGVGNGNPL